MLGLVVLERAMRTVLEREWCWEGWEGCWNGLCGRCWTGVVLERAMRARSQCGLWLGAGYLVERESWS